MKTTRTPKNKCPACGYQVDAVSEVDGNAVPEKGDISICLNCGAIAIFKDDLTLRKPTGEELLKVSLDPNVIKHQIHRAGMNFPDLRKRRDTK